MKHYEKLLLALMLPLCVSCVHDHQEPKFNGRPEELSLPVMARIISELPMDGENFKEVHEAVSSSSDNGYDEEYMMSDLIESPGSGVGDVFLPTRSSSYSRPMRELLAEYFEEHALTKTGGTDACLEAISASDMQIYWPYSENWDGKAAPVITFDPQTGEDSNYGYEPGSGKRVEVTEELARERPVWVVNLNDDSEYTPVDFFERASADSEEEGKMLSIRSIKALRNYDSWFGGASEFFVKCGAVDGFRAKTEEEMRNYHPEVTDFMVVVKRNQVGKTIPFNALLLSDYTPQMEKIAFLVTEDDGGTVNTWDCEAVVKYSSKSYGFNLSIPYRDKDDIVWRGQLSRAFFEGKNTVEGRFGDMVITFDLR